MRYGQVVTFPGGAKDKHRLPTRVLLQNWVKLEVERAIELEVILVLSRIAINMTSQLARAKLFAKLSDIK